MKGVWILFFVLFFWVNLFDYPRRYSQKKSRTLAEAYIYGGKRGLEPNLLELHQRLGLTHLFTPSGLHLTSVLKFLPSSFHFLMLFLFLFEGLHSLKRMVIFRIFRWQLSLKKAFWFAMTVDFFRTFFLFPKAFS